MPSTRLYRVLVQNAAGALSSGTRRQFTSLHLLVQNRMENPMVPTVSNKTRVPWNYSRLDKMQLSEHIPGLSPHMDAPKVLKSRLIGSGNGRGWFSRLCCPHQCNPRPQISRGGKLWYKKTRVSNLAAGAATLSTWACAATLSTWAWPHGEWRRPSLF